MRALLILSLFALGLTAPVATADVVDSGCNPPCGPIPVIITITLDKSRNVEFDENNQFTAVGKVQYYYDIDDSGYAWNPDPREEVWVNLKVSKAPAWTTTTIEPTKFRVPTRPYDDPTNACTECVKPEGDAPQMQFSYEHPIKVTVQKTRDFDAAELKRWLKSDGTYRVTLNAVSNDSYLGHDSVGEPAGLQEGYGVKEIRFIPPAALLPSNQKVVPEANAPGVGFIGFLAALGIGALLLRRD